MKRIVNTGKAMRKIVDTGPCMRKVDPAEVAKALGASSVEEAPKRRTGTAPPHLDTPHELADKIMANPALAASIVGPEIMADIERRGVFPKPEPDPMTPDIHDPATCRCAVLRINVEVQDS